MKFLLVRSYHLALGVLYNGFNRGMICISFQSQTTPTTKPWILQVFGCSVRKWMPHFYETGFARRWLSKQIAELIMPRESLASILLQTENAREPRAVFGEGNMRPWFNHCVLLSCRGIPKTLWVNHATAFNPYSLNIATNPK